VKHVVGVLKVSERHACRALSQQRSTQRYECKASDDEKPLVAAMLLILSTRPRFGYRRVWALLRADGWRVNRKRVHRLWRKNGLKVPQKQVKKRRLGTSDNGIVRQRATKMNEVWTIDFIFDRTQDGRSMKYLTVLDEFTRECPELVVHRSMNAKAVIDVLSELMLIRGVPKYIRCDNGPEFASRAIRNWLSCGGVKTLYIEPGSPWQNGFVESFHARLRDELLETEVFATLSEARELATRWRMDYNHHRPHSALNYQTPAAFAGSELSASVAARYVLATTCERETREPIMA